MVLRTAQGDAYTRSDMSRQCPADAADTLKVLTQQMAVAATRCSHDFRYQWANQAYADWLQRPLDEIVGRPICEVLGKNAFEALLPHFNRVLTGETVRYEQETDFRGIGPRWIAATYTPTFDADGVANGWLAIVLDITERKNAGESLRLFRALLDQSNDAIEVIDPKTLRLLDVNQKACQGLGYSREELLNLTISDIDPFLDESLRAKIQGELDKSGFVVMETCHRRKDGSIFPVEVSIKRVPLDRAYIVTVARDITERKRSEEARLKHAAIVESSDDAIISMDLEAVITSWNAGAERIFGYTEAEVLGQPITTIIPPELRDEEHEILARLRAGGRIEHYETKHATKTGKMLDVSITISPIKDSAGRILGFSKIARDITERKQSEVALRESEQRFRLAAQAGKMYSFEWDVTTDSVLRSSEHAKVLGVAEPLRLKHQEFVDRIHPDDRPKFLATIAKLTPEQPTGDVTYRLLRGDGGPVWLKSSGRAFFDGESRMLRVIGMVADVTDQKLAEEALEGVARKLVQAQEQERSRIARELHDDICQRIVMLSVNLEALKSDFPAATPSLEQPCQLVENLGRDIQALSHRLHSSNLEYLGLESAAASFCKEACTLRNVEIEFRSEGVSKAVPNEISLCLFRVLQEAIHNAIKHSGARRFDVSLQGSSNEVQLIVRDSGIGFDPEKAIAGYGIGLISMRERLKLVDGQLFIDSKPHVGTTILARVPLRPPPRSVSSIG
jgi:PAS domain S-box-containing protein